jgi:hypothetical protein
MLYALGQLGITGLSICFPVMPGTLDITRQADLIFLDTSLVPTKVNNFVLY